MIGCPIYRLGKNIVRRGRLPDMKSGRVALTAIAAALIVLGFFTIRASIEVAEDGQSFAGTYTFEPPAAFAEAMGAPAGQLGPGEVTGQRVAVEPMGEPVSSGADSGS